MPTDRFDLLEPAASALYSDLEFSYAVQLSIAVSVKRLADAATGAQGPVGEMAQAAAIGHGQMILDVDTMPDGAQHAHAVAVWDDADEGGRLGD